MVGNEEAPGPCGLSSVFMASVLVRQHGAPSPHIVMQFQSPLYVGSHLI
jgi:hypothetical protein